LFFLCFGFFFFFIRFHLILFCLYIKYGTHSLDCCFFSFNFVTQHFISLLFFSRFSPYFFNCSFLILFLICFLSILSLGILFLLFFNPILVLSFFISFSYFMYRLSPLLFSFISFYTRFGHHYFDYYLFSS